MKATQFPSIFNTQNLGFEDVISDMLRGDKYPFFNLMKDATSRKIEVAVAGFRESELTVTYDNQTHSVDVVGTKETSVSSTQLFKGISSKNFHRSFYIGPELEVESVSLEYGILSISLKTVATKKDVKKFTINQG